MTNRVRAIARPHAVGQKLAQSGGSIVASRERPADRREPRGRVVTHDYSALAFYTGGRTRIEQNGEHRVRAGDLVLVPAGQPHRMLALEGSEYWGLAFCTPCFTEHGGAALLAPLERVRDGASPVVPIPLARHAFLESLFRELGEHSPSAGVEREAIQRSLLTLVLAEVERAMALTVPAGAAVGGGVVVQSLRFIERNCLRRLTLAEIARAVQRTPTYVTAALKEATGKSAGEWIISGRMAEARRLLSHSDELVEVIAERVGYADATHFIRMFRREHGATPAAWRAQRR